MVKPRYKQTEPGGKPKFAKLPPRISIITLGLAFALAGCQTSPPETPAADHSTRGAALELNHGKRWVVPNTMMVYVRDLERAVQQAASSPNPDHPALAARIQELLGELVTHCTMKGKAHDELHKWLMPFLGVTAEYAKATDPQVQREKFHAIQKSLEVFNAYFQ